jgi:Tfp pilus assembly protein PilO
MNAKQKMLAIGGSGLVLAALQGFLVWSQQGVIEEKRGEVVAFESKIEQARTKIAKTPDLEREVILRRETDEVAKRILPNNDDILNFVRTLREFEEQSGATISQIKDKTTTTSNSKKKDQSDFERVAYAVNFEADSFQMLAFLDFVESHQRFMRVPSFKLKAAKRDHYAEDPTLARHEVELEVETYRYQPRSGSKRAEIDGYERKRDLLATEISARQREMTIEAYDYKGARNRRDPWVDPRMPANSAPGDLVLSIEDQIRLVEDLVARTKEASSLLERWKGANNLIADIEARSVLEKSLAALEEEARRVDAEGQLLFLPAQQRFHVEVLDEIGRIRSSLAESDDLQVPIAVLEQGVETMRNHLASGEYELALEAFAGVEGRLPGAERDPSRSPYVDQLEQYRHMARTVLEFADLALDVRGVVDLGGDRKVALINGKTYAPGELVAPELMLVSIESDQLSFVFKEVKLTRPLSQ